MSASGDAGEPVVLAGDGAAAAAFRAIADKLVAEVAPPVNMAGCSARVLSQMVAALEAKDPGAGEPVQVRTRRPAAERDALQSSES